MELIEELHIVLKLIAAFILGAFIGFDRERDGKSAGVRTYAAVCLGSTLFTDIGQNLGDISAGSRIISNIISGIGFLGAGIIFKNEKTNSAEGLTTAATVWCTAAIGVAVGLDMFIIAIVGAVAVYSLLTLPKFGFYVRWKKSIKQKRGPQDDEYPD
ncbi:MgtC/SapB family protein [Mucilaginibacter myungsuensis]|uniref:MgtC/SapB family protein n=1 Tax=Mucilaginibacter myungsuensis TaxID=649104 RepID=A0A929KX75_9SPHI|nr:MgtC/SapB family protein [Mucilaginibacter myungsuensis]MBE9662125.1 MgtC/SapB family protein [Mucilaginibacter myungsuensis]MDN3599441.1 MgtC/SapB family protein [Mucilaginibacter myungsuensis]